MEMAEAVTQLAMILLVDLAARKGFVITSRTSLKTLRPQVFVLQSIYVASVASLA